MCHCNLSLTSIDWETVLCKFTAVRIYNNSTAFSSPATRDMDIERQGNDASKAVGDSSNRDPSIRSNHAGDMYDLATEKHAESGANPVPNLQRKLKSRHLQMIAIGESSFSLYHSRLLTSTRRYHWNRSLHRQRDCHCPFGTRRCPYCLYLCRYPCLLGHDISGGASNLYPDSWRVHDICMPVC